VALTVPPRLVGCRSGVGFERFTACEARHHLGREFGATCDTELGVTVAGSPTLRIRFGIADLGPVADVIGSDLGSVVVADIGSIDHVIITDARAVIDVALIPEDNVSIGLVYVVLFDSRLPFNDQLQFGVESDREFGISTNVNEATFADFSLSLVRSFVL
jgi:hypothetical protein